LSYLYSGARAIQDLLSAADLACTQATGIIPLCAAAAETWQRVEGRPGAPMSSLAAASIRSLVTVQVTVLLADAGKTRWCELATASPRTAESFLQVFPGTAVVFVHRSCPEVIRAGIEANPWGLQDPAIVPYTLAYPGNTVAALAAYWAACTEQLLAFETGHPEATHRICYEDITATPSHALPAIRTALQLNSPPPATLAPVPARDPGANTTPSPPPGPKVPVEMIPRPLREHISDLHAQLGYPP